MIVCKICGEKLETPRKFASHLRWVHKTNSKDYTLKYNYKGIIKKCIDCNKSSKYIIGKYSFGDYCEDHAKGSGFIPSWKKGLTKDDHEGIARQASKMTGPKNHFYKNMSRKIIDSASLARSNKLLLSEKEYYNRIEDVLIKKEMRVISPYSTFMEGKGVKATLDVECLQCMRISKKNLWSLSFDWSCCLCKRSVSNEEKEVVEFIKSLVPNLLVIENDRGILKGKELDILIPQKKFAIEYNGLYWHTEDKKGIEYHSEKTIECRNNGIQLFHIFSDEWIKKRTIIESMLAHRLGLTQNKIYARKCIVREIDNLIRKDFFNRSHISGDTRSRISFGLYTRNNDELVSVLSLRIPYNKKYKEKRYLEIARFSTRVNTSVVGGLSKLLNVARDYAIRNNYSGILTYADLRFGLGDGYNKMNYEKLGNTVLDYWYTDNESRFHRTKCQATRSNTEREIAIAEGLKRVYGCGSNIYLLRF